jgi:hypothetical protein
MKRAFHIACTLLTALLCIPILILAFLIVTVGSLFDYEP